MLLWLFRGIFVVMVISVLMVSAASKVLSDGDNSESWWAVVISGLGLVVFFLLLDILTPKRKLTALAGVFFGLLVGMLITAVLAKAVDMIGETYRIPLIPEANLAIKWMLGIGICYFTISIVMRTKDDFRFVIPYIAFAKQTKGMRPLILDTSAIVDGRIADLCESRLFDAPVVVPRFVLNELQLIADSSDKLKRNRGRRGLDVLKKMQASPRSMSRSTRRLRPRLKKPRGSIKNSFCLPRSTTVDWRPPITISPRWLKSEASMSSTSTIWRIHSKLSHCRARRCGFGSSNRAKRPTRVSAIWTTER